MTVTITGIGVVTPLGLEVREVAERMARGERANRVGPIDAAQFVRSDRLRRCARVTHFAVAAAAQAVRDAGMSIGNESHPRVGVISAVSKGPIEYSRKFHAQFVRGGAKSVSPMLFPETVANASASHVASVLGLTGPNTTLFGDAAVGFNALAMARDILKWNLADAMLVVAPHEHDDIFEDAYRRFRWLMPKIGFSEGAAAMLLTRDRTASHWGEIVEVDRGQPWRRRSEIPNLLAAAPAVSSATRLQVPLNILSVSGDEKLSFPNAQRLCIKDSLGDAFAAGALWQVVFGLQRAQTHDNVLATCVGLNEQVSATLVRRS